MDIKISHNQYMELGVKINRPGQLAPGGEDIQGGGKISREILPPGG